MKVKISNLLFCAAYVFLCASLFTGDMFQIDILSKCSKIIRLVSYLLLFVNFMCYHFNDFTRKKRNIIILLFLLFYSVVTRDLYWIFLFMILISSKNISARTCFKLSAMLLITGIVVTLSLFIVGNVLCFFI